MDLRAWMQSGKRPPTTTPTAPTPTKQARVEAPAEAPVQVDERAEKLLAMEEFLDQMLEVRKGEIYCVACKVDVGCEPRLLRQHCFQD